MYSPASIVCKVCRLTLWLCVVLILVMVIPIRQVRRVKRGDSMSGAERVGLGLKCLLQLASL